MLSTSAFNALLKTLEEPPPHVIFIFATTEPKKIPATILSRCQHHSFRRITKNMIKEHLKSITDAENIKIKDAALEMIAKAADGSMRDSLTLLDQACSFSDDIDDKELQSLLGLPETEVIANLSEMILAGDISNTLTIVKELTDRGSDLRQLTKELVETFRNIAVIKITPDAEELLEFSSEEVERLRSLTEGIGIEPLTLILSELLRLEGEVRNAINPRYTLELGLLRMSFVKGMTSIQSVLKKLGDAPSHPEPAVQKPAIKKPAPSVAEKKSELTEKIAATAPSKLPSKEVVWRDLLKNLDTEDHLLYGKLAEARPVHMTTTELSIGFNGGMAILADSINSKMSVIRPVLKKVSGHNLRLKIVSLPDDKSRKDIKEIKDEVYTEPIVQDAMKIFNGSVLKVKPLEDDGNSE
jgi:DNA polymerase-3 subunit gamma/tau